MMRAGTPVLEADPVQFLRVAAQGASVATHRDVWQWLGGDVQALLPHDLVIAAWGDFRSGDLQLDLISSLPGLRTQECRAERLAPLVSYLRDCWAAAQHAPCQVDVHGCAGLFGTAGDGWAPGHAITAMRSAVVHGTRDASLGGERIFAALSTQLQQGEFAPTALKLLMPFLDTALRRIPTEAERQPRAERSEIDGMHAAPLGSLSERERQIMVWVAMGKTNPEIGCILRISEFTVKNHMKSIFSKLDVTNRAQAVARLTRMAAYA
jgi:transcriptional regulator EpsA